MLLDDLVNVIDTLKKRIKTHHQLLQQNETRTRMALIDPLLTALGWDVSDPSLVMPEYNIGSGTGRADYALNGSKAIPVAIVEAKRLSHALDANERMQMLNYANMRGVRYAAVTDGNIWELYEVFKQAPLEDRCRLSLKILETSTHELALGLLLLWRPNLASGVPVTAQEPILGDRLESAINKEVPHQSVDTPFVVSTRTATLPLPAQISSTDERIWVWEELSKYKPKRTKKPENIRSNNAKPPKRVKFPNGDEKIPRFWKDFLLMTGEWLNKTGRLSQSSTSILTTDSSKLRRSLSVPGTKFYVEGNRSADAILKDAVTLLKDHHISLDEVLVLVPKETP